MVYKIRFTETPFYISFNMKIEIFIIVLSHNQFSQAKPFGSDLVRLALGNVLQNMSGSSFTEDTPFL